MVNLTHTKKSYKSTPIIETAYILPIATAKHHTRAINDNLLIILHFLIFFNHDSGVKSGKRTINSNCKFKKFKFIYTCTNYTHYFLIYHPKEGLELEKRILKSASRSWIRYFVSELLPEYSSRVQNQDRDPKLQSIEFFRIPGLIWDSF